MLEGEIRKLAPNLPENIRGFRSPTKKNKPEKPEIKVVAVKKDDENNNLITQNIGETK